MTILYPVFHVGDERVGGLVRINSYHKGELTTCFPFITNVSLTPEIEFKGWTFFDRNSMDFAYRMSIAKTYALNHLDFFALDNFHNSIKFFFLEKASGQYLVFDLFAESKIRRDLHQIVDPDEVVKYVKFAELIYLDNPQRLVRKNDRLS